MIEPADPRLARLVALSTDEDSLDWDTLAQIDQLAWGMADEKDEKDDGNAQS